MVANLSFTATYRHLVFILGLALSLAWLAAYQATFPVAVHWSYSECLAAEQCLMVRHVPVQAPMSNICSLWRRQWRLWRHSSGVTEATLYLLNGCWSGSDVDVDVIPDHRTRCVCFPVSVTVEIKRHCEKLFCRFIARKRKQSTPFNNALTWF